MQDTVPAQFVDRAAAGRELGAALAQRYGGADCAVLALPRGGVPVAAEVAGSLGTQWDVFVVRKLGVPAHPELAFGAVASGGIRILNEDVVSRAGLDAADIDSITATEQAEVRARDERYRDDRPRPQIAGRTAILVDDGIATGATIRAAVDGVRALGPGQVVVAAPVAAPQSVRDLAAVVDDVVVLTAPPTFGAVGSHYADFRQVTDQEVAELLATR